MPEMLRHRMLRSTTGLVVIVICIVASITLILAFQPQIQHQRLLINQHQQQQVHQIAEKLDETFYSIHQQLLNLTTLTEHYHDDPRMLEGILTQLLRASSPDAIYGMGIWFERGHRSQRPRPRVATKPCDRSGPRGCAGGVGGDRKSVV
mgnify:CR=1 FL=1